MSAWLWVMAGSALGAAARSGVGLGPAPLAAQSGWPLPTLPVNAVGSLLLGLTLGLVGRGVWLEAARLAFGTGVLGAFTTFSAFSAELGGLLGWGAGSTGTAALYAVLSVGLGVGAAVTGRLLAERL